VNIKKLNKFTESLLQEYTSASGSIEIYFGLLSPDLENPVWEFSASLEFLSNKYQYTLQGHGIGKSEKVFRDIPSVIHQIHSDNTRFNSGQEFFVRTN